MFPGTYILLNIQVPACVLNWMRTNPPASPPGRGGWCIWWLTLTLSGFSRIIFLWIYTIKAHWNSMNRTELLNFRKKDSNQIWWNVSKLLMKFFLWFTWNLLKLWENRKWNWWSSIFKRTFSYLYRNLKIIWPSLTSMGSPLRYHLTFALGSDTKHSITASFLLVTEYFSGSFCVKKYSGSLAEK